MDSCLRDEDNETMNKRLAGLLFEKTKDYPLQHSSWLMTRAVNAAIREKVPEVIDYI